jgi:hypothetical protein
VRATCRAGRHDGRTNRTSGRLAEDVSPGVRRAPAEARGNAGGADQGLSLGQSRRQLAKDRIEARQEGSQGLGGQGIVGGDVEDLVLNDF